MSEFAPQPNPELARENNLAQVVEQYFPDDREFVAEMEFEDALGFIYGQLLEAGEDPDEILHEFGVTEADDEI